MKTIVVGFSRPKKFKILSWLIQKIARTDYSHVYIKFYSSSLDRELIYQASGLEVNFIGSELFFKNHLAVEEYKLSVSDEAHLKALRFAVDKAGMPYSIKQLFGILFYMITGKVIFRDGRSGYVCSELIGQMLSEEFAVSIDKDLDVIVPKDINDILKR